MDMKIGFAQAQETDALVDLINQAYRGSESWTGERDLISGARTNQTEISACASLGGRKTGSMYMG